MRRLAVIANCEKPRANDVLRRVAVKARELGLRVAADKPTARLLRYGTTASETRIFDGVDGVLALGGDGTVLRVARALGGRDRPIMGVNVGGLGFLTSVAEADLERGIDCLAADRFTVSNRAVAEVTVERRGRRLWRFRALNDAVVARGRSLRVVTLDVSVGRDRGTSYVCDGLIVSTPTGSTGHSLSANGPIVSPDTSAFVISLICPHTLSSRPLVAPDRREIVVGVSSSGGLLLSIDGQVGRPLVQGDLVRVRRSAKGVKFVHLPGYSYFSVLRQKLRWSGRSD
ncbi:MAG: NAD(+)/NADH kinase [Verrucomicrobiota bacterium]|nr:NAD(+)/NADH kinase [Verrucomicrobiota bacterium]